MLPVHGFVSDDCGVISTIESKSDTFINATGVTTATCHIKFIATAATCAAIVSSRGVCCREAVILEAVKIRVFSRCEVKTACQRMKSEQYFKLKHKLIQSTLFVFVAALLQSKLCRG